MVTTLKQMTNPIKMNATLQKEDIMRGNGFPPSPAGCHKSNLKWLMGKGSAKLLT